MKVYTSGDIRFLEKCAVESGVTMAMLMEKAGSAVAAFTMKQFGRDKKIIILCGKGNNGGDGFVCARRLAKIQAQVTVILADGKPKTELAQNAFASLPEAVEIIDWEENKYRTETLLENADIIVDAVFGFGFAGEVEANSSLARLIGSANKSAANKIAVDLPSGAQCDTGKVKGVCFRADYTVTFTAIKPANVLSPSAGFCGKNVIAPVGIEKSMVDAYPSSFSVIKESMAASRMLTRDPQGNKGSFGRLLMICGSYGMAGACIMAAKGALRSGVGLLNIAVPKEIYPIIASQIPEAIYTVLDGDAGDAELFSALKAASACLIGCGLGALADRYVPAVLRFAECPVILDADAINYVAKNIEELARTKNSVILTPHPGEMARLIGKTAYLVQENRFLTAKSFAAEYGVYTVLKGAGTLIAAPDGEMQLNITGNVGMAKGGSGDVLAGIISSLCAQGLGAMDACCLGVYVHGKAGDVCARRLSVTSMLPTDLAESLPEVFLRLETIKSTMQ